MPSSTSISCDRLVLRLGIGLERYWALNVHAQQQQRKMNTEIYVFVCYFFFYFVYILNLASVMEQTKSINNRKNTLPGLSLSE